MQVRVRSWWRRQVSAPLDRLYERIDRDIELAGPDEDIGTALPAEDARALAGKSLSERSVVSEATPLY